MNQEGSLHRMLLERSGAALLETDLEVRIVARTPAADAYSEVDLLTLVSRRGTRDDALDTFHAQLSVMGHATVERRVIDVSDRSRHIVVSAVQHGERRLFVIRDETGRAQLEAEARHLRRIESIGFLTASLVHDFNNLLTPIRLIAGRLVVDAGADARTARWAREIESIAERSSSLVKSALRLARRAPAAPSELDVSEVVADLRELVARILGERVLLVLELAEPGSARVRVEREQLEHVILNLAANARDALPNGGRVVIATARASAPSNRPADDRVFLSVVDDGVGMSPQVRERACERFFTTKEDGRGTGIGLASAQRFVDEHGGRLRLRSEVGQGTDVTIELPRAQSDRPTVRMSRVTLDLPRGSETILLVEDDERVRSTMRALLEQQGYGVLDASCADQALACADRHDGAIDLLLTDVDMPGASGPELVRRLSSRHRSAKVLFMSGHTSETIGAHGVDATGATLIRKDFSPAQLVCKVRDILDATG